MKKYIILAIILIVFIGTFAGWFFLKREKISYRTIAIDRGDIIVQISATGTVNPVTTIQVGSQVSGTITKRYVDYDSKVKKGQVIAELDPALFQAQVDQARGSYLSAQATLHKSSVTLADAKRTLARNNQLLKQGVIAQSDFDASQTTYETAEASVKAAQAGLVQSKGALVHAETNRKNAVIRSPVTGVVISRNVDVGQTVAASFQTPTLFTIAQDLTKMQIETSVDEADISKAKIGQRASFTVDAYPDRQFSGTVTQIRSAPVTVQNVVTYIVIIQVDNTGLFLKPGMTANVSVETARRDGVMRVPAAAVRFRPKDTAATPRQGKKGMGGQGKGGAEKVKMAGRQQTVYLLENNQPKATSFQSGIADSQFIEILESKGLQEGTPVIVEMVDSKKKKNNAGMNPHMGPRM